MALYLFRHPSSSASEKEWSDFLARMMKYPQDHPDVQWAVRAAHRALARIRDPNIRALEKVRAELNRLSEEVPCDEQQERWLYSEWLDALKKFCPTSEIGVPLFPPGPAERS